MFLLVTDKARENQVTRLGPVGEKACVSVTDKARENQVTRLGPVGEKACVSVGHR